jgi:hypothetical protein
VLASDARAFQSDVHYQATFAIALASGWSWDDARLIAGANQGVDENIDTRPSILISERSVSDPPQTTRLEVNLWQTLGALAARTKYPPGLSLQDFAFHCFRRTKDAPARRNRDVDERLALLERDVLRAVDAWREQRTTANRARALVAVGIYLHCQQDSWSHSGYGGEPLGHVKDGTRPDHPANDAELTTRALRESEQKLLAFRERLARKASRPIPDAARSELLASLTNPTARETDDSERITCNTSLTEYWLRRSLARSGRLDDVPDKQKLQQDTIIAPRTVAVGNPGGWQIDPATGAAVPRFDIREPGARKPELATPMNPAPAIVEFLVSGRCDRVFTSAYAAEPHAAARNRGEACLLTAQPCPPLPFPRVVLPPPIYPALLPDISIRDPVNEKGTLRTLN